MISDTIHEALRRPECRTNDDTDAILKQLERAKRDAVRSGDEDAAKHAWCLERTVIIQRNYNVAFDRMKAEAFFDAWCSLAAVERHLSFLVRHKALTDYRLEFIKTHTVRFQGLYPYRWFLSPAFIVRERRCGICDAIVTPRRGCEHRKFEIYGGEMCTHTLRKVQIPEVSVVTHPVEKECVLFGETLKYNYALVQYVVGGLASLYHGWNVEWSKVRRPHGDFVHVSPDARCPCGAAGTYEECCLREDGVSSRHCSVMFEVSPSPEYLETRYHRGWARSGS